MASEAKPLDVARAFTRAWTSGDLDAAASYVADDVVFDGPLQQSTGAKPYIDGLTKLACEVTGVRMIAEFGNDAEALLMYDLHTGPWGTLTCAKHLRVRNGKIIGDQLTFDSF